MKKLVAILITLFALAFLSAQTGGTSGSQGSTGGQTGTSDQGARKGHKGGGGEAVLTGCLSGPNSEGVYTLKHGKKEVEVGGLDDLSKHVGNKVKLHGSWASASEIGEKEEGAAKGGKEEKGERHFKVTSIDHIADTCGGGEKHKKGSSDSSQPSTPPK